ncbi:MAG TPA: GNAT family N-acetyltransferase [Limnochordia bacterium]|nr:GNAT family N-acetyltransferase [Limnochordia bacterium]
MQRKWYKEPSPVPPCNNEQRWNYQHVSACKRRLAAYCPRGLLTQILNIISWKTASLHGRKAEAKSQFLNQNTESCLICLENKYVGIIDFLESNPSDNCPWIGLLMIHGKYHRKGYGNTAYNLFEEKLKQHGYNKVHIGILTDNVGAKRFWTSLGFRFYTYKLWQGKTIECYEKQL